MIKKVAYGLFLCSVMVGRADASVHDYPPAQVVVDKLYAKTYTMLENVYHAEHTNWYCTTKNRVTYRCYLTVLVGRGIAVNNARFKVTVKKGYRHTKIYEDISGTFNINRTRYGVLNPLDW